MSEYEWETRRVPRSPGPSVHGLSRPLPKAVAAYIALEFPWETAAWVLRSDGQGTDSIPAEKRASTARPNPSKTARV